MYPQKNGNSNSAQSDLTLKSNTVPTLMQGQHHNGSMFNFPSVPNNPSFPSAMGNVMETYQHKNVSTLSLEEALNKKGIVNPKSAQQNGQWNESIKKMQQTSVPQG